MMQAGPRCIAPWEVGHSLTGCRSEFLQATSKSKAVPPNDLKKTLNWPRTPFEIGGQVVIWTPPCLLAFLREKR
jgi:hypothetical protein